MRANVLILCDGDPDYGADYTYDGFRSLIDDGQVVDWPAKRSLHLGQEQEQFDCDLAWPAMPMDEAGIRNYLCDAMWDLIVVPTLRGAVPQLLHAWHEKGWLDRVRDRIVAYDAEDHTLNTQPLFHQALGAPPAVYFKRELPAGERWGSPLPFGYPGRRVVESIERREPRALYSAHIWDTPAGAWRRQLGEVLQAEVGARLEWPLGRLTPRQHHERQRTMTVGVAPRGAGWGTNRLLELVADGCAVVAEEPTVECLGMEFEPSIHWFRSPAQCAEHVRALLADPSYARTCAGQARAWLLRHHTTYQRAKRIWEAVHQP